MDAPLHPAFDPATWALPTAHEETGESLEEAVKTLSVQVWEIGEQVRAQNTLLARLLQIIGE